MTAGTAILAGPTSDCVQILPRFAEIRLRSGAFDMKSRSFGEFGRDLANTAEFDGEFEKMRSWRPGSRRRSAMRVWSWIVATGWVIKMAARRGSARRGFCS